MKATLIFKDQIHILDTWFNAWNACEQTVAMYTMFRKMKSGQLRFLLQVLQQSAAECTDIHNLEAQANNPAFVADLCHQSKDHAVQQLLECLPLLKPNSHAAKAEYLSIIPKIFTHSLQKGCNLEESRHLLSYCLIHPAITAEERGRFQQWLVQLDEWTLQAASTHRSPAGQDSQQAFTDFNAAQDGWPLSSTRDTGIGWENVSWYQSQASIVGQGAPVGRAITSRASSCAGASHDQKHDQASHISHTSQADGHRKLSRSAPITPPNSNVCDWLNRHHEEMAQLSGGSQHSGEPHAPLSPQSSESSSGSDCHEEHQINHRNTFLEEGSGMRDVPIWLKTLRLHKYAYLFQQLTYHEMLGLTEEWLASQNVTKGARHKIVLSINKLRDRQNHLRQLEKDVLDCCNLRQALQEVKSLMNTPIKHTDGADENQAPLSSQSESDVIPEGDIPGQITRLMGKLCTQLLVVTRPEDDCFGMYLLLVDKCMSHEGWTVEQKKKLASWKQQIQKTWQPSAHKYMEKQRKLSYAQDNFQRLHRALLGQQLVQPITAPKWAFGALPPNLTASVIGMPAATMPLYRNNSFNTALNSRPALYELQAKQPISKTSSVPLTKSNLYGMGLPNRPVELNMMEPEIAARLDSLCLSMTEHALGNIDSPEKGSTL